MKRLALVLLTCCLFGCSDAYQQSSPETKCAIHAPIIDRTYHHPIRIDRNTIQAGYYSDLQGNWLCDTDQQGRMIGCCDGTDEPAYPLLHEVVASRQLPARSPLAAAAPPPSVTTPHPHPRHPQPPNDDSVLVLPRVL
jgi:hypothetical protein